MIRVETYRAEMEAQVDALWREAFPDDPPRNRAAIVIPAKLAIQPELLLVALDGEAVVGTAMAGYDGHRGWLYSVAVKTAHRRRGVGRKLVAEAEARLRRIGCTKINLQVRSTNAAVVGFYRGLGYEVENRISLGKVVGSGEATAGLRQTGHSAPATLAPIPDPSRRREGNRGP